MPTATKRPIIQKKWVKGLISCTPVLSQAPNSVPLISNGVYTTRGAIKTCDGSDIFTSASPTDTTGHGAFLALKIYTDESATVTGPAIPQTAITSEQFATEPGFSFPIEGTFAHTPIVPGTVTISFPTASLGIQTAIDNGSGQLTGTYVATGSINYATGQVYLKVTANQVQGQPVTANYSYYSGSSGGGATVGITNVQYEVALQVAPGLQLGTPTALRLSQGSGTLPAGSYTVYVTATDLIPSSLTPSGYRETSPTSAMITTSSPGSVISSWSPTSNAAAYAIYMANSSVTSLCGLTTALSFTQSSALLLPDVTIPSSNNTGQTVFRKLTTPNYDNTGIIGTLPASIVSGGTTGFPVVFGYTPNGGQLGVVSPLPSIVDFVNQAILILGNGLAPQSYTNGGSLTPLTNTYTVSYPAWTANTAYQVDDLILPATPNGYYFQCTQAGESGGSEPSWPSAVNKTITDGSVLWTCVAATAVIAPRGAASAVVYAGSLWLWNTYPATTSDNLDGPSCLKMSTLNNPQSWDPLNIAFVDKDDGDQGMGMAVFSISEAGIAPTNSLVLFKSYKSYLVSSVFGSQNFAIQRIQTDMGCVSPASIQFVPGLGIVRLTHLGFASTDGISDKVISEEIRPYLFGGGDPEIIPVDTQYMPYAQGAQVANPPMYICGMSVNNNGGAINRLFCYDLVQQAWTVIDLPFSIYAMTQIRSGPTGIFVVYPTQLGGFTDGVVRNWQNGDANWDTGAQVVGSFKTPEVYSGGGSDPFFLKKIAVRGISQTPNITVTLVRQGTIDTQKQRARQWTLGANNFILQAQPNARMMNCAAIISFTGPTEIDLIEWDATAKPPGVPLTFMR
jgi:hypothetical protein